MRIADHVDLSVSNLWRRKLRTFLTAFGVVIAIGALVSMVSFGQGIQKNVNKTFRELDLFNHMTVYSDSLDPQNLLGGETATDKKKPVLDEEAIREIQKIRGVETAIPDIRFPASVTYEGEESFNLIQVVPAEFSSSKILQLREGQPFRDRDENSIIVSDSLLRELGIKDPSSMIGKTVILKTLVFDLSVFDLRDLSSLVSGDSLPFSSESYELTVVGVAQRTGFGGPMPLASDVYIPPGTADRMKKLPITSLWELFRAPSGKKGYSLVNVRLASPEYVEPVKNRIENLGFRTFALIEQFDEFRKGFFFMDMFLFAVGMIGIVVASLGIVNTMVMSILERYSEIGIMKAVGAGDRDIQKIFFFESSMIGLTGGLFGLGLGWAVSLLINEVINYISARQGLPLIDYFSFPWWLCLGAVVFAVIVSLAAGIYPAMRAARVDPVVALRHD